MVGTDSDATKWPAVARLVFALLAILVFSGGCSIFQEEQTCDICSLTARLVGTVQGQEGGIAVGATVHLFTLYDAGRDTCGGGYGVVTEDVIVIADPEGRFDALVSGASIIGPRCIEVVIDSLPALGLGSLVDTVQAEFSLPWITPKRTHALFFLPPSSPYGN